MMILGSVGLVYYLFILYYVTKKLRVKRSFQELKVNWIPSQPNRLAIFLALLLFNAQLLTKFCQHCEISKLWNLQKKNITKTKQKQAKKTKQNVYKIMIIMSRGKKRNSSFKCKFLHLPKKVVQFLTRSNFLIDSIIISCNILYETTSSGVRYGTYECIKTRKCNKKYLLRRRRRDDYK